MQKHTARYQLSRFLQSQESFNLNIDFKDVAILVTMFDFMDAGSEECCLADQKKLSKLSRVPLRTLVQRIQKLIDLSLIKKSRSGVKNSYQVGDNLKRYVQSLHLMSAVTAPLKCSSRKPLNYIYNNNYKENNVAQNKNRSEIRQTAKFYEPGHPSYDSLHS